MNDEKISGKAKELVGKTQQHVGRATGDRDQEARGHAREVDGKVEKKVGDVKQGVKDILKKP
jgi:uncharacterized protein YjbJ (UPF0337 family)